MPVCPSCKKNVDALHLTMFCQYQMSDPTYVCKNCNAKMVKSAKKTGIVTLIVLVLWFSGFLLGVVPDDIFGIYLLGGIIGLPLLFWILYKAFGG